VEGITEMDEKNLSQNSDLRSCDGHHISVAKAPAGPYQESRKEEGRQPDEKQKRRIAQILS
jgi:hypothetical protein